jgi:O-antigen ligase
MAINIFIFMIVALLILFRLKEFIEVFITDKLLIILLCYIPLTVFWSDLRDVTLLYSVKFVGITLVAVYIAMKCTLEDWFKFLVILFGVFGIVSFMICIIYPPIGVHSDLVHHGSWKGIFGHKNALGTISVIGLSIYILSFINSTSYRFIKLGMIFIFLATLILSNSITALIIFLLITIALFMYKSMLKLFTYNKYLFVSILSFVILLISSTIVAVFLGLDSIFSLMGRDITLSGRTTLWQSSFEMIKENILFGYGYGGFWSNENNAFQVWKNISFMVNSSHSGILDIWLDLGIVGLLIISIGYFVNLTNAVILTSKNNYSIAVLWSFVFLLFMLFNNITDSRLLNSLSIYWAMYITTSLLLRSKQKHS